MTMLPLSATAITPEREVQTGIGLVTVKVPKVRSKTGKPVTFHSALVPPDVRKAKSPEAALPWLYLKGISTGKLDGAQAIPTRKITFPVVTGDRARAHRPAFA